MADAPEEGGPDAGEQDSAGEPRGIMIPVVMILFGILIVMIVFMNVTGQNTTASSAITENPWALQSMTDEQGVTTPALNGTTVTAQFTLDGKLTGNGGCNGYSGRYLIKETKMVISRVDSTSLACWDSNATRQEEQYFNDLEEASALRVHERTLTLYDSGGKPRLTFGPAYSPV